MKKLISLILSLSVMLSAVTVAVPAVMAANTEGENPFQYWMQSDIDAGKLSFSVEDGYEVATYNPGTSAGSVKVNTPTSAQAIEFDMRINKVNLSHDGHASFCLAGGTLDPTVTSNPYYLFSYKPVHSKFVATTSTGSSTKKPIAISEMADGTTIDDWSEASDVSYNKKGIHKLTKGVWYTIRWEWSETEVVGYLNGEKVLSGDPSDFGIDTTFGTMRFSSYGVSASYRNIKIDESAFIGDDFSDWNTTNWSYGFEDADTVYRTSTSSASNSISYIGDITPDEVKFDFKVNQVLASHDANISYTYTLASGNKFNFQYNPVAKIYQIRRLNPEGSGMLNDLGTMENVVLDYNTWHTMKCVVAENDLRMYIDGELILSSTDTCGETVSNTKISIGAYYANPTIRNLTVSEKDKTEYYNNWRDTDLSKIVFSQEEGYDIATFDKSTAGFADPVYTNEIQYDVRIDTKYQASDGNIIMYLYGGNTDVYDTSGNALWLIYKPQFKKFVITTKGGDSLKKPIAISEMANGETIDDYVEDYAHYSAFGVHDLTVGKWYTFKWTWSENEIAGYLNGDKIISGDPGDLGMDMSKGTVRIGAYNNKFSVRKIKFDSKKINLNFADSAGNIVYTIENADSITATEEQLKAAEAALPEIFGYSFVAWNNATEDITEDTTVKAIYAKDKATKYNVLVDDGEELYEGYHSFDARITVAGITETDFSYWKDTVGNSPISNDLNYTFYVPGDLSLKAIYGDTVNKAKEILLNSDVHTKVRSDGKYIFYFTGNISLPESATLNTVGITYTDIESSIEKLNTIETISGDRVISKAVTENVKSGAVMIALQGIAVERIRYAKLYVTYTLSGNSVTVFSDCVAKGSSYPENSENYESVTYALSNVDYKQIGRNIIEDDSSLYIEMTAAGFSFNADCMGDVSLNVVQKTADAQYYTVVVDGAESEICIEGTEKQSVQIAESLPYGEHTFSFYKQSEGNVGGINIYDITLKGTVLSKPADNPLLIEFVGDSLTCGYGNLVSSSEAVEGHHEDGYNAYGTITARLLGADWSNISRSSSTLFDARSSNKTHMPTEYTKAVRSREELWDFKANRNADVVVVNLGTNDDYVLESYGYDTEEKKTEIFQQKAYDFAKQIIEANGEDVKIVFAFGLVTSEENFVDVAYRNVVETLADEGYENAYYCRLPSNTAGGGYHPTVAGHNAAAETLANFLKTKVIVKDVEDVNFATNTYSIPEAIDYCKITGRYQETTNGITFDWSANTLEFNVIAEGDITMDINVTNAERNLIFVVYIDGVRSYDFEDMIYCGKSSGTYTIAKDLEKGFHNIRLVRDTQALVCAEITAITMNGELSIAPEEQEYMIEVIGDSISCGEAARNFSAQTGDSYIGGYHQATETYAYLTAEALGADTRFVTSSGKTLAPVEGQFVSMADQLYDLQCFMRSRSEAYDNSNQRAADFVIINLGQNDLNYSVTREAFKETLLEFAPKIKALNKPDTKIVFLYGMLNSNTEFNSVYSEVAEELGGEANGYYSLGFTKCKDLGIMENRFDPHPAAEEHKVYADELTVFMKNTVMK